MTGPQARLPAIAAIGDHAMDELRFVGRGERLVDRVRICRMLVHLHLRVGRMRRLTSWLPRRRREFDLRLEGGLDLRLRTEDVVVIFIFGMGEYDVDLSPIGEVDTLLDLGANVGMGAVYLASRLGPRRVVCVEPSPSNFRLLEENLRRNLPVAVAVQAAAAVRTGSVRVEESHAPGETTVTDGVGEIRGMTISEILDAHGIDTLDLLKIDIEGGEIPLFEQASDWAPRVRAILGEVHPPLTVVDAERLLAPFGFVSLPVPDRSLLEDVLLVHRVPEAP